MPKFLFLRECKAASMHVDGSILVINCGSSSVKFALFGADNTMPRMCSGSIARIGLAVGRFHAQDSNGELLFDEQATLANHTAALGLLIEAVNEQLAGRRLLAVGHRVVHADAGFHVAGMVFH